MKCMKSSKHAGFGAVFGILKKLARTSRIYVHESITLLGRLFRMVLLGVSVLSKAGVPYKTCFGMIDHGDMFCFASQIVFPYASDGSLASVYGVRKDAVFFRWFCGLLLCLALLNASADDAIRARYFPGREFALVREALIESIEAEGLVVGQVLPFEQMLARTRQNRQEGSGPYRSAEIIQFCSSGIAWQLAEENAENLALCPMSIAIYVPRERPDTVVLAWRSPGAGSAGRIAGEALLQRLVERASELSRLSW